MSVDPVVSFFLLGLVGGLLKSELELPRPFLEALTIFLLIALGLKGGVALSRGDPIALAVPALTLIIGALALCAAAFLILWRVGGLRRIDAAATAAHYGSVSVITFVVAQTYLGQAGIAFSGEMTFFLAVLEVPALVLAAALGQREEATPGSYWEFTRELIFGKSVLLLIGGMAIGAAVGEAGVAPLAPLFFDLFKGVVCFLLLELGVSTARQLPELRRSGAFLAAFGVLFPLAASLLGALLGRLLGFSLGDQVLTAVLFASASYIAAPSAMRVALPHANLGLAIAPVLAVTFPFNVVIGIPLYVALVERLNG
ncbi:MAG: sodium-dependent bicarbonate transport family permease [Casimicrobiaceae bacterium]|nr:sodium-dependent bicarbonate transport family permease [Casimicrobiaceae bacterium]MCX8099350.1 sodium-dependent bicarbonate transport family permease [Casimicrobiaceae bacterium]MDW8311228.1 sodium-dependent bicarbonate transport family permease [Burkholderiales bacterium]